MTPTQTFDPRDPWAKARRIEVYRYAREKGIVEINEQMPKDLMVERLKALGVPPPSVPPREIGAHINARSGDTSPDSHHYNGSTKAAAPEVVEMNAIEVLARDWKQQQAAPPDVASMTITQARQECKRRGIKIARTDNMIALKAKLDGQ